MACSEKWSNVFWLVLVKKKKKNKLAIPVLQFTGFTTYIQDTK